VDGVDDLGFIDALRIDRRDAEVAVTDSALDDNQRHAFARHLHRVSVTKLVWGEAPSHPGVGGNSPKRGVRRRAGPVAPTRGAAHDREQRPDWEVGAQLEPRAQLLPSPFVHADLATPPALPRPTTSEPRR
jgi:hypothetical protein